MDVSAVVVLGIVCVDLGGGMWCCVCFHECGVVGRNLQAKNAGYVLCCWPKPKAHKEKGCVLSAFFVLGNVVLCIVGLALQRGLCVRLILVVYPSCCGSLVS